MRVLAFQLQVLRDFSEDTLWYSGDDDGGAVIRSFDVLILKV